LLRLVVNIRMENTAFRYINKSDNCAGVINLIIELS